MTFVAVGTTHPPAEYGNVVTKGICSGFCMYLAGKVTRANYNEGNLIL
jgi:hypothetical protein